MIQKEDIVPESIDATPLDGRSDEGTEVAESSFTSDF